MLLAAAVPAESDSVVLELGAGAGIASLCLAARVPGARIIGIEIDPELVRLANENAARNAVADRVSFVSVMQAPILFLPRLRGRSISDSGAVRPERSRTTEGDFDHVFFNPPFHPDTRSHHRPSPRATARRAIRTMPCGTWTGRALSLVRDGGTVTAIVRADRVDDMRTRRSPMAESCFPLLPRVAPSRSARSSDIVKGDGAGFSHRRRLSSCTKRTAGTPKPPKPSSATDRR